MRTAPARRRWTGTPLFRKKAILCVGTGLRYDATSAYPVSRPWPICDDFENVDQIIFREVAEQASMCGFTVQRSDIVEALTRLVDTGLVKAYDLSASGPDPFSGELRGMPPLDVIEENFKTYFYVTKRGLDSHLSDPSWPFDDEGILRSDWSRQSSKAASMRIVFASPTFQPSAGIHSPLESR